MDSPGELIAAITAVSALIGSLSAGAVQWGLRAAAKRKAMAEAASLEAGVSSSQFAEWKNIVEVLREEVKRLTAARIEDQARLAAEEKERKSLEGDLVRARADIQDLKALVRSLRRQSQPGD